MAFAQPHLGEGLGINAYYFTEEFDRQARLNNIIGISEYDLDVGGNAKAWEWK
jgi:hypothetical protein